MSTRSAYERADDPVGGIAERRHWAYRLIRRCTVPPPPYGSAEWLALPEGTAEKIAAVCVAAEAWAQAGDTLEDDLRREVETARRTHKQAEDADYQTRAARHRQSAPSVDVVPFIARRQAQLDAAAPRDGDHRGGPVEWSGDSA